MWGGIDLNGKGFGACPTCGSVGRVGCARGGSLAVTTGLRGRGTVRSWRCRRRRRRRNTNGTGRC